MLKYIFSIYFCILKKKPSIWMTQVKPDLFKFKSNRIILHVVAFVFQVNLVHKRKRLSRVYYFSYSVTVFSKSFLRFFDDQKNSTFLNWFLWFDFMRWRIETYLILGHTFFMSLSQVRSLLWWLLLVAVCHICFSLIILTNKSGCWCSLESFTLFSCWHLM